MRGTLKDVARNFPTAIVTGRCRDKVHFLYNKRKAIKITQLI